MNRILYRTDAGGVAVVIPTPEALLHLGLDAIALGAVPAGKPFQIVATTEIPQDRTFRNAWELTEDGPITINLPKSKEIAHGWRRQARSEEFAPLDVEVTIPGKASEAEAARQAIRDKYAAMQIAIDSAQTAEEVKFVIIPILENLSHV